MKTRYVIDWWETLVREDDDLPLQEGQVRVETVMSRTAVQAAVEELSDLAAENATTLLTVRIPDLEVIR